MTYRDTISDIRSMLKLISADATINDRTILGEIKTVANMIMGQSFAKREYWQNTSLFTFFPCIEMEKVPLSECCSYQTKRTIARSKNTYPKMLEGSFGTAIHAVISLDGSSTFSEKTPMSYANLLELGVDGEFFWFLNDRLYISKPNIKKVNMYAYPAEIPDNSLLINSCECTHKPDIDGLCANPVDQKFPFPSKREKDLKDLVYDNLLKTYFNIAKDKTSNQLDEQSK